MSTTLATTPDFFRAFADATRLRLLNLLLEGEQCVCDLCAVLEEIQPKVSRHLAYLRRAGLVQARSDGKWKYYRTVHAPRGIAKTLLDCVASCLRQTSELQADLCKLRALRRSRDRCC